jgi:hypothetical protein
MNNLKYALDVPARAIPYLASVEQGSEVDRRSVLWKDEDRDTIVKRWSEILFNNRIFNELESLEHAQAKKVGPVSIREPFSKREESVSAYYSGFKNVDVKFDDLDLGNLPSGRDLRPLTSRNSAHQLPTNTNSGLPFFNRRKAVQDQSVKLANEQALFAALLGWRGQSSGEHIPKQRVVWMFPYSWNIMEGRYFRPVFNILRKLPQFSAWNSLAASDKQITGALDNLQHDQVILSSDYSKFDQSVGPAHQAWFFDYLKILFQPRYHNEISLLQEVFRSIPLVATRDKVYTGVHGVPSGSTFTNLCDSVVNHFVLLHSPASLQHTWNSVQGDDAVLIVNNVEAHLKFVTSVGLSANASKQHVSDSSVSYLQRLHHRDYRVNGICVGVYPTMRALNSLLGQERYHKGWSSEMETLRVLAILENTRFHPLFDKFVEFVKTGDNLLVENTRKLIGDTSIVKKAKAMPGFVPSYNQETDIDGLKGFAAVQEILS